MPDITMCTSQTCERREQCYRAMAKPDKCCMASTTVSVFGDLRDYGGNDIDKLKEWFNDCCKQFMVRQAVMHVIDEYADEPIIVQYVE